MGEFPNTNDIAQALGQLIFANGGSMLPKQTIQPLADKFGLSEDLLISRKASDDRSRWDNRVHWARLILANEGLIEKHIVGRWELTDEGNNLFGSLAKGEFAALSKSAIDDLDPQVAGNEQPGRAKYAVTYYLRDEKVRRKVIKRANGRCEHCGSVGFEKPDGTFYIEAHHIISLAKQGPDTLQNVIALCANHHRQAHFGSDWEQLEGEFKAKLAKLRGN